jgi:hypothetical protein
MAFRRQREGDGGSFMLACRRIMSGSHGVSNGCWASLNMTRTLRDERVPLFKRVLLNDGSKSH